VGWGGFFSCDEESKTQTSSESRPVLTVGFFSQIVNFGQKKCAA
jgi:hypothetical protein